MTFPRIAMTGGSVLRATVLTGLLTACTGSPPPPPPPAGSPSAFQVKRDSSTKLLLTWNPPAVAFDGYTLEISIESEPYVQLNTDLIPNTAPGVYVIFQTDMPELLHLGFRLTAIEQGKPTGPGATVAFMEKIHSPELVNAYPGPEGITIQLGGHSKVADRFHIVRSDGRVRDVPFSSYYVFFNDPDVAEDVPYSYSVTLSNGDLSSDPVRSTSVVLAIVPPVDFSARSTDAGHIELRWTNRSARANDYLLRRWPGTDDPGPLNVTDVAHLPPGAGSYDDAVPAPGVYSYRFEISSPSGEQAVSRVVPGVTAPSGTPAMSGTVIASFGAYPLLVPDGGVFAATTGGTSTGWRLIAPSGATFDSPPESQFATDGYVVDPAGRVHALMMHNIDAGPDVSFTHVWFDGARWLSEPAGAATPYYSYPFAALAFSASGRMQIAWVTAQTLDGFVIAEQQPDGGFTVTQPDTGLSGIMMGRPQLVMGQAQPHLVFSGYLIPDSINQMIDLSADVVGRWSVTAFPVPSPLLVQFFAILPEVDGGFAVACACNVDDAGMVGLGLVRRSTSGWDPAEPVGAIGSSERVIGGFRGGSVAIATQSSLYSRDDVSTWGRADLPLFFYGQEYPSQVGYLEDAGVFVVSPIDSRFTALFVEEP